MPPLVAIRGTPALPTQGRSHNGDVNASRLQEAHPVEQRDKGPLRERFKRYRIKTQIRGMLALPIQRRSYAPTT